MEIIHIFPANDLLLTQTCRKISKSWWISLVSCGENIEEWKKIIHFFLLWKLGTFGAKLSN
jgi:hypothetical protein